jgi:hypothetical protein
MPVSMNKTPVIKGEFAKKLLESIINPPDNSEFYKKCEELSKIFKNEISVEEILEYLERELYYLEKNVDVGSINFGGNQYVLGYYNGKKELLEESIKMLE